MIGGGVWGVCVELVMRTRNLEMGHRRVGEGSDDDKEGRLSQGGGEMMAMKGQQRAGCNEEVGGETSLKDMGKGKKATKKFREIVVAAKAGKRGKRWWQGKGSEWGG